MAAAATTMTTSTRVATKTMTTSMKAATNRRQGRAATRKGEAADRWSGDRGGERRLRDQRRLFCGGEGGDAVALLTLTLAR